MKKDLIIGGIYNIRVGLNTPIRVILENNDDWLIMYDICNASDDCLKPEEMKEEALEVLKTGIQDNSIPTPKDIFRRSKRLLHDGYIGEYIGMVDKEMLNTLKQVLPEKLAKEEEVFAIPEVFPIPNEIKEIKSTMTNLGKTKEEIIYELLLSLNQGKCWYDKQRVEFAIEQYNELVEKDIVVEVKE